MTAFVPIPVHVLTQNAGGEDQIYVKYKNMTTGQTMIGGVYVRADSQMRYLRLRSTIKSDPKDNRNKLEFSVQIKENICFMVRQNNARLLHARAALPILDVPVSFQFQLPVSAPAVHSGAATAESISDFTEDSSQQSPPHSPFRAAGYDWALSDIDSGPDSPLFPTSQLPSPPPSRLPSPNIDKDNLY